MTLRPVPSALLPRATSDRPDQAAGARPRPFADVTKPDASADAVRRGRPLPAQILPSATYSKPQPNFNRPLPSAVPGPVPVATAKPLPAAKLPDPAADIYYASADLASDVYTPQKDSASGAKPRITAKA